MGPTGSLHRVEMGMRGCVVGLVAAVLMLPLASAIEAHGAFVVQGPLSLPKDSQTSADRAFAVFVNDSSRAVLNVTAPSATVHWFERRSVAVDALEVGTLIA